AEADDYIQYAGKPPRRLPDGRLDGLHALWRFYRAAAGWVFLACYSEQEWRDLCEAIGKPALAKDSRFATEQARLTNDSALAAVLEPIFKTRRASEWETFLAEHGVACAEAASGGQAAFAVASKEMRETGMWAQTSHPSLNKYHRYGPAVTLSECKPKLGPTIFVGEHTQELLGEIGYSEKQMKDLFDRKIVTWSTREADPDA
ncbi:MAG: CoA transferase, partial [Chloroflexi bacterium]|nr:CoA transferase [Chloroflexota bacterium]